MTLLFKTQFYKFTKNAGRSVNEGSKYHSGNDIGNSELIGRLKTSDDIYDLLFLVTKFIT